MSIHDLTIKAVVESYLKENLQFEVKTTSTYTGGMYGGSMYRQDKEVVVYLGNEVVTTFTI